MRVHLLVDNRNSWIRAYALQWADELRGRGYDAVFGDCFDSLEEGEILFLLGCEMVLSDAQLKKHQCNLVVHESALPEGRGWSPLTWQILEGKREIHICLFEALEAVDTGPVYEQTVIVTEGHELIDELRRKQAQATWDLILRFLGKWPNVTGEMRAGKGKPYPRRTAEDSRLVLEKSLKDQFDLLRVVDNERYPAFFDHMGHRYVVKVEKHRTAE